MTEKSGNNKTWEISISVLLVMLMLLAILTLFGLYFSYARKTFLGDTRKKCFWDNCVFASLFGPDAWDGPKKAWPPRSRISSKALGPGACFEALEAQKKDQVILWYDALGGWCRAQGSKGAPAWKCDGLLKQTWWGVRLFFQGLKVLARSLKGFSHAFQGL